MVFPLDAIVSRAAGKVALGKVAPGRLTPVLFALRKSDPLERLPQGIFALPEYETFGIFTLWKVCPKEFMPLETLISGNLNLWNVCPEESLNFWKVFPYE